MAAIHVIEDLEGTVILPFPNYGKANQAYWGIRKEDSINSFAGIALRPYRTNERDYAPRICRVTGQQISFLLLPVRGIVTDTCFGLDQIGKVRKLTPCQTEQLILNGKSIRELEAEYADPSWPKYNGGAIDPDRLPKP